jgi:hypothetical protein
MPKTLAIQSAAQPLQKQTKDRHIDNLQERIRQRAYELYEARGYTAGHEEEDWHIAETEILAQGQSPRAA